MERYILAAVLGVSAIVAYQALSTPAASSLINRQDTPGLGTGDLGQAPTNNTERNQRALKKPKAAYGYKKSKYF
jgi:hypothetical protein